MRSAVNWLRALALACMSLGTALAGEAAWNEAGSEYAAISEAQGLMVGPAPGRTRAVALPKELEGKVLAVGHTKAEGWILLSAEAVWRRPTSAAQFERWLEAGPDVTWQDLAVDGSTGNLLLTAELGRETGNRLHALRLYVRKLGRLQRLFARRVGEMDGPSFAPDGTLYFGSRGDLWHGRITPPEASDGEELPWILEAGRWVPLAYLETANATPASYGVRATAATSSHVFVHIYRLGGSGFGWIARLPGAPWSAEAAATAGPLATWRRTGALFRQIEVLGSQGRAAQLATSPQGKVGFLLDDGPRVLK